MRHSHRTKKTVAPMLSRYNSTIETDCAHPVRSFYVCLPAGHAAEKDSIEKLTGEVEKFKKRRELCDHFRGEDPYDEERRRFLEEN